MNLFRIALRNLGRTKSRTILSLISIAVGVFVVLLSKGTIDGILEQMIDSTVRFSSGHVRVIDQEYAPRERLLSLHYTVDATVVDELQEIEGLATVSPRIRFGGLVSRDEKTEGVMVTAIDHEREEPLSQMSRFLQGRWMETGAREAVLGSRLLQRLGLEVGERFTLVFTSAFGSLRGFTFEIVGELNSGYSHLDDRNIFVDVNLAQSMLEMEGEVTEVLLYANNEKDVSGIFAQVNDVLSGSGLEAVHWQEHSEMIEYLQLAKGIYVVFYLIVLLLASFVVINTMVMIVNERVREIGMLAALGLNRGQILRLFLYEGSILGAVGSIVGAIFGSLALWAMSVFGLELMDPTSFDAEFFMTPKMYPVFNLSVVGFVVVLGILVTTLAVLMPSRQAARLEPTRALRGNL